MALIDLLLKYDPNQPRDNRGRWTYTGASWGRADILATVSPATGMSMAEAMRQAATRPETVHNNSPYRKAMRNRLTRRLMAAIDRAPRERKLDVIIGKPGAGKSTHVKRIQQATGSFDVDPDKVKTWIPEYGNGEGASSVHKEASDITDRAMARGFRNGTNMIIQGTGKTYENLAPMIAQAKKLGYRVNLIHVKLPLKKALQRMTERYVRTGRYVPPDFMVNMGDRPMKNFRRVVREYSSQLDGYAQYDSDVPFGSPPRTVIERLAKSLAGGDERPLLGPVGAARHGAPGGRDPRAVPGSGAHSTPRARRLRKSSPTPGDVHVAGGDATPPGRRKRRGRRYRVGEEIAAVLEDLKKSKRYSPIAKIDEERRIVIGWASVITKEDGTPLEDLQGDVIDEHDLVLAADQFMRKHRSLGKMHTPRVNESGERVYDAGEVFEHFVITKQAKQDLGLPGHVPCGWLIAARVRDDDAWGRVKSGEFKSFSIGGGAVRVPLSLT